MKGRSATCTMSLHEECGVKLGNEILYSEANLAPFYKMCGRLINLPMGEVRSATMLVYSIIEQRFLWILPLQRIFS